MLLTIGTCNSQAAREYVVCYPGQCHPGANVFWLLGQRLCETGKVIPKAHVTHGLYRHQSMKTSYLQLWHESHGEAHFIT
jgi:hypothetical protein